MADQEAPNAETPAEATEPVEQLHPKEARRRDRQRGATARAPRTPEERQAERDEARARQVKVRTLRRAKDREKAKARPKAEPLPAVEHEEGRQKVRQGIVTSAKPDKTITVRIDAARRHRRYEKIVRSSTTLHVHDETNDANEGDTVRVVECRPLSRLKRWKLVEVLERAK